MLRATGERAGRQVHKGPLSSRHEQHGPSGGNTWLYRFSQPGGIEIETRQLDGDETAEEIARELSKSQEVPVVIERHNHVDWEYVTEADERP